MIKWAANGFVKSYLEATIKAKNSEPPLVDWQLGANLGLKDGRGEVCAHEPPSNGMLGRDLGWVLWPCISYILDKGQGAGGVTKLGYL